MGGGAERISVEADRALEFQHSPGSTCLYLSFLLRCPLHRWACCCSALDLEKSQRSCKHLAKGRVWPAVSPEANAACFYVSKGSSPMASSALSQGTPRVHGWERYMGAHSRVPVLLGQSPSLLYSDRGGKTVWGFLFTTAQQEAV